MQDQKHSNRTWMHQCERMDTILVSRIHINPVIKEEIKQDSQALDNNIIYVKDLPHINRQKFETISRMALKGIAESQ